MFKTLRTSSLVLAVMTITAPMAHVLELPNKMQLDGPLWLAVQKQLYRGWGEIFGPLEILALLAAIMLAIARRKDTPALLWTGAAALSYAMMIAVFFIFNAPVNDAFDGWVAATLPENWPAYRLQWDFGHALAAGLSMAALITLSLVAAKEIAQARHGLER
jgi:hypothetical protein